MEVAVPIVAVISLFVILPVIIVGAALGGRLLKLKERELVIRQQELEVERERITTLKLLEENERMDRVGLIAKR